MPEDCLYLCHHSLLNYSKNFTYRHFGRTLKIEKCKKFVSFSNNSATYIFGELLPPKNLNIDNFTQTFENLLLQNYSTEFLDIAHKWSLVCVIYICSKGGFTYITGEIIAKYKLNIANLMQTSEKLLLQNY